MDYTAIIQRFAQSATDYCQWLEGPGDEATEDHFLATRLLAELYASALALPDCEPGQVGAIRVPDQVLARVRERLQSFPFQYYWEIFNPVALEPEVPVCGDIVDDLLDVYRDVKEGLDIYQASEESAVWHWRATFGFHWGRHVASALHALHNFDPELEGGL